MDFKHIQSGGWVAASLIFGNTSGLLYAITGLNFFPWLVLVISVVFGVLAAWGHEKNQAITFFFACLFGAMLGGINGTL